VYRILFFTLIAAFAAESGGQDPEKVLRSIFENALTDTSAYSHLRYLCKETKGRIPGSEQAEKAVMYTFKALVSAGADNVQLQRVPVPSWKRGREFCEINSGNSGRERLNISALGLSEGTPENGIRAEVIEVKSIEQLRSLGENAVRGKIVFFSRPVDNTLINTFSGYGGAVDQRISGPSEASRLGAAAAVVRSATQFNHDFPHTGVTRFGEGVKKIPAVAVSPLGAELLSRRIRENINVEMTLISTCSNLPDAFSYNVVAELRGYEKAGEIITVGAHLDSWDITEGAHDDAGGCVQAIETIRLFKTLGIRPRRTVRVVMFMNEEISGTGGRVYADQAALKGELHYAALESDRGVMSPRGFGFDAEGERLKNLQSLSKWFEPYNIRDFERGGGGSDIAPLKALGALQIGYMPDVQRYFEYHHSSNDTFEKVNPRELQMGSAAIASLIYLIDIFGF
jgi:hypothetical protein